jgi:hypothetical protein
METGKEAFMKTCPGTGPWIFLYILFSEGHICLSWYIRGGINMERQGEAAIMATFYAKTYLN